MGGEKNHYTKVLRKNPRIRKFEVNGKTARWGAEVAAATDQQGLGGGKIKEPPHNHARINRA